MSTLSISAISDYEQLSGEYVLDPDHTWIGFVARHAMVTKVRGRFLKFDGRVHVDGEVPDRSRAALTIDGASVDTRNEMRDEHLRSSDFFELDAYPHLTFTSTAVEQVADDVFRVSGDLTIKATTRPVTFDLTYTGASVDDEGELRIGFEGATTINRKDWGVTWNHALETGGVLVSEKVTLEFDISAVRA